MSQQAVAVITGGASGIGRALASVLARDGVHVVVADIDQQRLDDVVAQISGRGGTARALLLDVTDAAAVQAAVTQIVAGLGRIDYLFNNAGVGGTVELRHATIVQWQRIVTLNLMGVIHGVQAAYPLMVERRSGHIVNTASISGLIPVPGQTLYNTTKYAIVGLSHTLRPEAARYGVRISVVCPGPVQSAIWGTPILGQRVQAHAPSQAVSAEAAAHTIWRGVRANAETIVFPQRDRRAWRLYRRRPGSLRRAFARQLDALVPPDAH